MGKSFKYIIILIGLIALAVWSPWLNFDVTAHLPEFLRPPESTSTLQIFVPEGTIEVYLDDKEEPTSIIDSTTSNIATVLGIVPGRHLVTLKRIDVGAVSYYTFSQLVDFSAGTDVILSYELGPTREFSGGHLIYAVPNNSDKVLLNIAAPEKAEVYLDDTLLGEGLISDQFLDISEQRTLRIQKGGFETQEFQILPTEEADRNRLIGYTINIHIDLFLQPIATS